MTRYTFLRRLFQTRIKPMQIQSAPASILISDHSNNVKFVALGTEFGLDQDRLYVRNRARLKTLHHIDGTRPMSIPGELIALYKNGILQNPTDHYILIGQTYEFIVPVFQTDVISALIQEWLP